MRREAMRDSLPRKGRVRAGWSFERGSRIRDTQSFDRIGAATTRRYGIVVFRSPLRRSSIRSKVRIKATSADTKGRVRDFTEQHESGIGD